MSTVTDSITVAFIDQVLGEHAALAIGAMRADVEAADMFDEDQIFQDYQNNMPTALDMLAVALGKLSELRRLATYGVPNCVNLAAIDRVLSRQS